ncbi:MAG: hypothetical protein QM831_07800 [Kofleriaceae bacterium]
MNYGQARQILAIEDDDGLTRKQLRRIYLRLLKEHPPEQDPDGFRDLREAFELLREYLPDEETSAGATTTPVVQFGDAQPEQIAVQVLGGVKPVSAPQPAIPLTITLPDPVPAASAEMIVLAPLPEPSPAASAEMIVLAPLPEPPPVVQVAPPRVEQLVFPIVATLPEPEPPMKLAVLVAKIIQLLEEGLVDTAVELEQDWRGTGDSDDFRHADVMTAARWSMVRELLMVSKQIPVDVVKMLARGLRTSDWNAERANLNAYRLAYPRQATHAHKMLVDKALTVYRNVMNVLYVPPPPDMTVNIGQNIRPASNSGGGFRVFTIIAAIIIGIVRFASIDSGHSYSSSYYTPPKLDLSKLDMPPPMTSEQMEAITKLSTGEPMTPKPYDPAWTDDEVWTNLSEWTIGWREPRWLSPEQYKASEELWIGVIDKDCARSRKQLKLFEAAPPIADETRRHVAAEYLAQIHPAMDRMCPVKPATKRKK